MVIEPSFALFCFYQKWVMSYNTPGTLITALSDTAAIKKEAVVVVDNA